MDYQKVLKEIQKEQTDETELRKIENEKRKKESETRRILKKEFLTHVKVCAFGDYVDWLRGYIENRNGRPTHYYDYSFGNLDWVILSTDKECELPALYGAESLNIIVPLGQEKYLKYTEDDLGHNNIYFMKDFITLATWIPVYKNMVY